MDIVCLDSSVLIEYFRKKEKSETRLYQLSQTYTFAAAALVEYEILRGTKDSAASFWHQFFAQITVLPFDRACAQEAARIYAHLKPRNQHQQPLDILIAATAKVWQYPVATLNTKHFEHIPGLDVL